MSDFSVAINYGFKLDDDERFRLVKEAGFTAVGLWNARKENNFDTPLEVQYELVKKYDLDVEYVHAPFNFHNHLRDMDESVRRVGIEEHKKWIDDCRKHNVDKLVIHINRITKDEYVTDNLITCLKEINAYAVNSGVKIAVENIGRPDDLQRLFDEIKDIYFCIDSSHAALCGDSEGRILEKYIDRLVCTHFSDNDGLVDRHWVPGMGIVNFENMVDILRRHNYKGRINCEVHASDNYQNAKDLLSDIYKKMDFYFGEFDSERKA